MQDEHNSVTGADLDRRGFLGFLAFGLTGAAAVAGAIVSAIYAVAPALRSGAADASAWSEVSGVAEGLATPTKQTVAVVSDAGWAETHVTQAVFLDRDGSGTLRAFSARCPHEGCQVEWRDDGNQFVCPCHSSKWTRDGERVAGPTKRGLDPLEVRSSADGKVEVRYVTYALDTDERIQVG
jgi:menaquinol-cytochrome c reductase iron-sulfur subunit